jgi:annexin A7/11
MASNSKPTVVPQAGFNAHADAEALRAAMKGFGTDEDAIIEILTTRSNAQRQEIAEIFKNEYGRDIIEDLKSELGGKLEDVVLALMKPSDQFLCKELNKAMDGIGTNEETLVEILCSKSNEEVKKIVTEYEEMYGRPLAEHLCSETDGHFRRLLTLVITGARDPVGTIDPEKAKEQAEALYAAGEGTLGTNEEIFYRILSHASHAQLELIFDEYKNVSGNTIEQALNSELSGEMLEAMLAIVECVQSPAAFFARRIHKAIDGMGTDDQSLIRIIVSRSEIDLQSIKEEYERIFDCTLLSAIRGETSGDYKKILCALIGDA